MASHLVRCPCCAEPNPMLAHTCASCEATLAFHCLQCGAIRAWHQVTCPQCGADIAGMSPADTASTRSSETSHTLGDRYLLRERLAASRTGAVYAAQDREDPSRRYVIKQLSTIALFRADERREAARRLHAAVERWRGVEHDAVVRIHELISGERAHYVVMDPVTGLSLRQVIRSPHLGVSPVLARNWGQQLCALLEHLHTLVPPLHAPFLAAGHVMITLEGVVRVVDLGLSHLFAGTDPTYGPYGTVKGYGAPELETAPPTPATDVYTVGRLLYALLAGVLLEEGTRGAPSLQRAVPGISRRLVRTIARAAHRDPAERFRSAAELADALTDGADTSPQPIPDWMARAPRARTSTLGAPHVTTSVRQRTGPSMEDFGFSRDERYGLTTHADVAAREMPGTAPAAGRADIWAPTTQGTPRLAVQPTELRLEDIGPNDTKRMALRVRNTGDAPLQARVISRTVGISAPAKSFRLLPGKQARVLLTVSARNLPAEELTIPRAVEVESNAGTAPIGLRARINTAPMLHVATPQLDFGQQTVSDQAQQVLVIENRGRRVLTGRIVANAPWLAPQRETIQCMGGQQVRVPVTLRADALPRGLTAQADALLVDSDGGQARIAAHVYIAEPQLKLDADALVFGDVRPDDTLTTLLVLHNTGDAELRGGARTNAPWLQISPDRFACPAGETVQLELELSTVGMAPGPLNLDRALQIRTNGGNATLPLRAELRAPRLVVIDEILDLGKVRAHERAQADMRLRNDGNAPLLARADALVPWLSFADGSRSSQISLEPGAPAVLRLVADVEALNASGETQVAAAVRIASELGVIDLPARLTVLRPALSVEPEALDFRYIDRSETETLTLQIQNTGTGRLGWSAAVDAEWVELEPTSGLLPAGASQTLTLTAYGLALSADQQTAEATLAITSDAGRAKIPLRVGIAAPLLATDTTYITLGPSVNRQPVQGVVRIFNHGLGTLRGVIGSDRTWLVTERSAFECPMGRSLAVGLYTDMEEFPVDESEDEAVVSIQSNGGDATVGVALSVAFEPDVVSATDVIMLRPVGEPDGLPQGRLVLRNQGLAPARAELVASVPQLAFSRHLCDVKPGKSVRIVVEWKGSHPQTKEPPFVEVRSAKQTLRIPVELAD